MTWQGEILVVAVVAFAFIAVAKSVWSAAAFTHCSACRSKVSRRATVCPACQRELTSA